MEANRAYASANLEKSAKKRKSQHYGGFWIVPFLDFSFFGPKNTALELALASRNSKKAPPRPESWDSLELALPSRNSKIVLKTGASTRAEIGTGILENAAEGFLL